MARTNHSPIQKLIKRETDKAVLVEIVTGRGDHAQVWFPRSQVEITDRCIWVADWLIEKKRAEVGGIVTMNLEVAA